MRPTKIHSIMIDSAAHMSSFSMKDDPAALEATSTGLETAEDELAAIPDCVAALEMVATALKATLVLSLCRERFDIMNIKKRPVACTT
tara:strand:+ start:4677 stop:4940 length:264 start_codon:yes stop_codon:yes gene_type:complete